MGVFRETGRYACAGLFLGACLTSSLLAQTIAPRAFRAVAGESRTTAVRDGIPAMSRITSTRTTPALEYPIRVQRLMRQGAPELELVIPPATPPGEYAVELTGSGQEGEIVEAVLRVTVDPVVLERATVTSRPPVILLNGFQAICGSNTASTLAASELTFGQFASLLQTEGIPVAYFNNCTYGNISIEQLAGELGNYLANLQNTDGTPVTEVDLVVHSMGGLIARAYLAGKGETLGVFAPPIHHRVRKLIAIGTPHFGSFQASYSGPQMSEMTRGNQFLWDLATWNQGQDDLRGVDALAIIGNAGTFFGVNNASDGVVSLTSASLGFAQPDQRTRIVPYCHTTPSFLTNLAMSCVGQRGIVDIDNAAHLSWQIVKSFLADTEDWQSIGGSPSTNSFLNTSGGTLVTQKDANDVYFTDLTSVTFDSGAGTLTAGPSNATASLYYSEFISSGQHTFALTRSNGQVTNAVGSPVGVAGSPRPLLFKSGPFISSVQSAVTGLPGLTVASGSNIFVNGSGLSGVGTQLTANGTPLNISSLSAQQITAFLPAGYNGLVQLKVSNGSGQHTVNIMAASATPAISPSTLTWQQGTTGTTQIATVGDADDLPVNLAVTVLSANPSNGVSIAEISVSGAGAVLATVSATCAATNASFTLRVTDPGGQFGSGLLNVTVTSGCAPVCQYSIGPGSGTTVPAAGGGGSINIATSAGCSWQVTDFSSWLTITSGVSGSGAGTVQFVAAANTGPARNGTITVAGQTYTVSQGAAGVTIPPIPENSLILSQLVGGAGWHTTLFITNLSTVPEPFTIRFYDDGGLPRPMPMETLGSVDMITGTLNPAQTVRYETEPTGPDQQAWAVLTPGTSGTERLSGLAIFRQTVGSGPTIKSSEAVVDFSPPTERKYMLLYDNAEGFVTSFALANTSQTGITILVDIRDAAGVLLGSDQIVLPPLGHMATEVPNRFPLTVGKRGSIRFSASPQGFTGLGLRFSPVQTFTSFRLLASEDMQ